MHDLDPIFDRTFVVSLYEQPAEILYRNQYFLRPSLRIKLEFAPEMFNHFQDLVKVFHTNVIHTS